MKQKTDTLAITETKMNICRNRQSTHDQWMIEQRVKSEVAHI